MNSYQRVMTALKREQPDRVPIVEWAISRKVIKALCPAADDQTDIEEMLDLDGVSTVAQYNKVSENADGTYVDEWGVLYKPTPEEIDHPIRGPSGRSRILRNTFPLIPMRRNAWENSPNWWRDSRERRPSSFGTAPPSCGRYS